MPEERKANSGHQSDAELVAHLERLSGRKIRSREDISAVVDDISRRAAEKHLGYQRIKSLALWALLLAAIFQYYFIDIQLEILAQPNLTVFVPVRGEAGPQRPYI